VLADGTIFAADATHRLTVADRIVVCEANASWNVKAKGGLDGSSILPTSTKWRRCVILNADYRRYLPGVTWFRQAARVTGSTACQASDINSAKTINVNTVYAKGVDHSKKYAGFRTNGDRYPMAA
jgi:hypothetical protein